MKTILASVIVFALALLAPQIVQAQGAMTFLSNLDQGSAGSFAVGSDSWMAALFRTGTNASGYLLDSIQLAMADATGSPSNFIVMIYSAHIGGSITPGSSLGALDGSLNPAIGGAFAYTPASNLTLSPSTDYFIVVTSGATVANGAYEWDYVTANSYNPSGGWSFPLNGILSSSSGSSWTTQLVSYFPQLALSATPVPEPGVLGLSVLGGLAFLWHRRKSKAVP